MSNQGGQCSYRQPANDERRCDIVWEIGDNPACPCLGGDGRIVGPQRVHEQCLEPAPASCLDLRKGWLESLVALDSNNSGGAFKKERAGQAARSWPDFKNRDVIKRAGAAGDSPGHIQVEDEVLAERLPGGKRGLLDDLAKGRQ